MNWNQLTLATLRSQISRRAQPILGVEIPQIQASHRQTLLSVAFAQRIGNPAQGEFGGAEGDFRTPALWQARG
ncbi:hypothetical protein D3C81_1350700 [compost metagenome]